MKGRDKGISMKPASLECAMQLEKYRALPQQNGRWEASLKSCLLISMCALYPRHAHNMHVHIEIKLMQQMLLYGLCEHQAHMWCIYINSGETSIHIRYFFFKRTINEVYHASSLPFANTWSGKMTVCHENLIIGMNCVRADTVSLFYSSVEMVQRHLSKLVVG